MALSANPALIAWPLGIISAISQFFKSVFLTLSIASSFDARLRDIERLQRLTDAQLAEKGLKRDEIVHYVYRDLFYV